MTHVLTSRHKCSILQRQKVTLFQPLNWSLNITVIGALFNFSNVFLFFPHFLFTQSWDFHFYNLLEGTWMNHSLIGAMYNKWCHISSQKRLVFGFSASMAVLSYFAVPCTSAKSGFWSALTLVWTGNSLRISGQSQHQDRCAEFENTFDCGHFFQTVNFLGWWTCVVQFPHSPRLDRLLPWGASSEMIKMCSNLSVRNNAQNSSTLNLQSTPGQALRLVYEIRAQEVSIRNYITKPLKINTKCLLWRHAVDLSSSFEGSKCSGCMVICSSFQAHHLWYAKKFLIHVYNIFQFLIIYYTQVIAMWKFFLTI